VPMSVGRCYNDDYVETECPCLSVLHQLIEGEHKEQCPKFPLPCLNNYE